MATVKEGDFVRVSYTGRLESGQVFDSTDEDVAKKEGFHTKDRAYGPLSVTVGESPLIDGFNEALIGMEEEGKKEVVIPPEKAYGKLDETLIKSIPIGVLNVQNDSLLAFFDFPAAHWTHIRTTNVIESTFATIRHRSDRAKGCVTRTTMLSMIYKMGMCAEQTWRRLRGFDFLGKVVEGVQFKDGIEVNEEGKAAA